MAVTNVPNTDTFEEWRVKTNTIAADIGDISTLYTPPGPPVSTAVDALNDLESRKEDTGTAIAMSIALG